MPTWDVIISTFAGLTAWIAILIIKDSVQNYFKNKKYQKEHTAIIDMINRTNGDLGLIRADLSNLNAIAMKTQSDIYEVKTITKHSLFKTVLYSEVKKKINNIITLNNQKNEELNLAFYAALGKLKDIISDILANDFRYVDTKEIIDNLILAGKSVKLQINPENLGLENFEAFFEEIKEVIIVPNFKKFAIKVNEIGTELKNGNRSEPFKLIILSTVESICSEIIYMYFRYKKK